MRKTNAVVDMTFLCGGSVLALAFFYRPSKPSASDTVESLSGRVTLPTQIIEILRAFAARTLIDAAATKSACRSLSTMRST